jgi:hypothetical protein
VRVNVNQGADVSCASEALTSLRRRLGNQWAVYSNWNLERAEGGMGSVKVLFAFVTRNRLAALSALRVQLCVLFFF